MDESMPSNSSPNSGDNEANHIENNDVQSHTISPERPVDENDVDESPILNEGSVEARAAAQIEDIPASVERLNGRETIVNGFLDAEEVRMQRHVLFNSSFSSQESGAAFNCKFPGCSFMSSDVELFLKHEDTHVDGGSMVCDVCNVRFATYANMRRHRLLHLGIRPFECQICTKRFLRKDQFMEHLLKHTKPRPFRCPFCTKTFSFRPHLKAHLTADHTNVVVDKTCRLCDFKASSPNGAKIHFAMCHVKQCFDASAPEERSHDVTLIGSSQAHLNPTENGAIDLATVSQNFSFVQAAHFPPYNASLSDSSTVVPGPSDLSYASKIHIASAASGQPQLIPSNTEQSIIMPVIEEDKTNRGSCISALAGSTTMVSSAAYQDKMCCRSAQPQSEPSGRDSVCVKPEPPELAGDDGQNNTQPTSTMDLATSDVVGTTCISSEASGSAETPCRRKAHKRSSSDETSSETHSSPPSRLVDSHMTVQGSRPVHTCYRVRQYDKSGSQRCREYQRHTCVTHRHSSDKRARINESDGERPCHDHSDSEERKVFYNRATSTNTLAAIEVPAPRLIPHASSLHSSGSCSSASHPETSYFGQKSTILIRDIESCTLTCPYCGIIFPDQTLYFLHRSLHSENSPWKCNLCGKTCKDKYDFNSHVISKNHY